MDKTTAETSIKNLYGEAFDLNPSNIVTLFEIDVGQIGFERSVISPNEIIAGKNTIFRFHNNVKLTNSSIYWNKKEYIAIPINAEGFDVTSKGTLPRPVLSLTVSDEGIHYLTLLKERIRQLGDLTGAKVTRIRTFAKFLDEENFYDSIPPAGFDPNPNSEFPRDVFYIDRKSNENKKTLEFELLSILDLENLKLPGRLVSSNSCPWQYRGEGCCYEYYERRNTAVHGEVWESSLPDEAPPIANQFNEFLVDIVSGVPFTDRGEYDKNIKYNSGDFVFITQNNINYYFVCNGSNVTVSPPDTAYWVADICSKQIKGCELRYALGGSAGGVVLGNLPFGGFPSCTRFK